MILSGATWRHLNMTANKYATTRKEKDKERYLVLLSYKI
jgi:hypothetical protein